MCTPSEAVWANLAEWGFLLRANEPGEGKIDVGLVGTIPIYFRRLDFDEAMLTTQLMEPTRQEIDGELCEITERLHVIPRGVLPDALHMLGAIMPNPADSDRTIGQCLEKGDGNHHSSLYAVVKIRDTRPVGPSCQAPVTEVTLYTPAEAHRLEDSGRVWPMWSYISGKLAHLFEAPRYGRRQPSLA